MTVEVSRPTEEPILIAKATPPHNREDMEIMFTEGRRLTEGCEGVVYYINDMSEANMSFHDSLVSMAAGAKFVKEELTSDGPYKSVPIFVGSGGLLPVLTKALGQDQYGNIRAPLFETVEEAVAYARERLAAGGAE